MPEVPVFGDPLEEPAFFQNSDPLPQGGERTRGPLQLSLGLILATGLTAANWVYVDNAAASHGDVEISVSVGTDSRLIEVGGVADDRDSLSLAWDKYLNGLNKILPGHFARNVRKLWSDLSRGMECPIPHAGPTQQGSFILTWDRGNHHFEVEVFSDNRFEWFYCDRATENYEGAEGNRLQAIMAASEYLPRLLTV